MGRSTHRQNLERLSRIIIKGGNMKTQTEKIISLFKKRKWVPVQKLHEICWRYGARIYDLKKAGYRFEKRRQKDSVLEEWHLINKKICNTK